uniref:Sulfhydryl oxidase n=1 Tax=Corethron hystrix TaxID=216773 RepID=A0A7S1C2N5_9STRA|mmetsp:Transcript_9788/g.21799  ORF Transcript_9788/g.21799 Transcript_9788/m.21799 type:complete len:620 (+) Transcript_9788:88-1947(+)
MAKHAIKRWIFCVHGAMIVPVILGASSGFTPHTVGSLKAAAKKAGQKEGGYLYLYDRKDNYLENQPEDESGGMYVWDLTVPVDGAAELDKNDEKEEKVYSIKSLLDPDKTSVVMFYAPWCGHCRHFKPTMLDAAKRIPEEVAEPLAFYGVSCTVNNEACRSYSVRGYPMLAGFLPGKGEPGEGIALTVQNFFGDVVDKLHLTHSFDKKDKKPPAEVGGAGKGSNEVDGGTSKGAKIVLDGVHPNVTAHMTESDVFKYKHAWKKEETYSDAALAFVQALKTGVYVSNGPLPVERSDAFVEWMHLLHWTLPPQWGLRDFVSEILSNIDVATSSAQSLETLIDAHAPSELGIGTHDADERIVSFRDAKYSDGCSHGQDGMGYTCGLWSLFHIVTIGFSQRYMHAVEQGEVASVAHAGECLRNFVFHFFGCKVCRDHFTKMYDSCELDNCSFTKGYPDDDSATDVAMWLWTAHNSVNARLIKERAEREKREATPEEIDFSHWPMEKDCSICWYDNSFDETMVYKFLTRRFWLNENEQFGTFVHHEKAQVQIKQLRILMGVASALYLAFRLRFTCIWYSSKLGFFTTSTKDRSPQKSIDGRSKQSTTPVSHQQWNATVKRRNNQ